MCMCEKWHRMGSKAERERERDRDDVETMGDVHEYMCWLLSLFFLISSSCISQCAYAHIHCTTDDM